jgi:ribose transport system ATP-binding protein
MVFQELSVVPELSLLDNLALAAPEGAVVVPYRRLRAAARDASERAGLGDVDLGSPVATLSLAQRQLLEIARGLMTDARVLILDEPTATLSDAEIDRVHRVVRQLVADGRCVVYITHRLGEVFRLSDRVTILRGGKVAASGPTAGFEMAEVVNHMLGTEHVASEKALVAREDAGGSGLAVRSLASLGHFEELSFEAPPGHVLAFFGQIGSGADQLVRTLAGIGDAASGAVELDGRPLSVRSRYRSQRAGIAYVSADRVSEGVFLEAPVSTNISSGALDRVSTGPVISAARERRLAQDLAVRVSLDGSRVRENVYAFSGGNQQKVAIARALATEPRVLVLNEPTRGVDVGARSEIYRGVRDLLARDVVVIVYSSDILEIRELADRVITLYRGAVVGEHWVDDTDDAALITEILNGAPQA